MTAYVYVWSPDYEHMLDLEPWDFESFMQNDFNTYWAAEVDI